MELFFFISKFLPLLIMPLGLSIFSLAFFLYSKSKQSLYLSLFLLVVFSNGISSGLLWQMIESPWKRLTPDQVSESDAIVVLSGGGRRLSSKGSKIIEWNDPDRFLAGLNLIKNEKSSKLIFTGGINPYNKSLPPEGSLYKEEAIKLGIQKESIYVTFPVKNTLEEVLEIKKLLKKISKKEKQKILLVTSAYHMHRAKSIFIKYGFDVEAYPVDFRSEEINAEYIKNPFNWIPSSSHLHSNSSALREILGRMYYKYFN